MTNPLRRFLVVSAFSIGLVVYWFLTIGQSSNFPTGEVQYAVMPALYHPYQQAWQAPYSVIWYGIQYAIMALPVSFFLNFPFLEPSSCPNNCMAVIQYVNGTTIQIPFTGGIAQWTFSLSWMIGLAMFNIPFFWLLRKSQMLMAYFMTSMWLWATTPVNLSILWITMLAYLPFQWKNRSWGWLFLPLSILVKLPVGAPSYVWSFAFKSGSTIGHWFPYALVGAWTIGIGIYHIDRMLHNGNLHWFPWLGPYSRVIAEYE